MSCLRGGHDPIVLEARDRVGGRVHSRTLPNGAVVEMGAEFILPGCTAVRALAERFSLGLWDKGMRYGIREPRGVEVDEGSLIAARTLIDEALVEGSSGSAAELLDRLAIDPGARDAILARAEVSAAASADRVPASELGGLARISDEPAPSIAGGNDRLATSLASVLPGRIRLNAPVREIRWSAGVEVRTDDGSLEADACVIAVPASVIDRIAFDPPLPDSHALALAAVEYGHAAKLFVPLRTAAPPSATLAVPDRYWAWTDTGEGDRPQPVVNAFAGSPAALERLGVDRGPSAWLRKLTELRPDLDLLADEALLSTWDDDPWVRAAYSLEPSRGRPRDAGSTGRPAELRRRAHRARDGSADGGRAAERGPCRANAQWAGRRRGRN